MVDCVIFDLDGTLLNTAREINILINTALRGFGFKEITLSQTISFIGNGAKKLVQRAMAGQSEEDIERVLNKFTALYAQSNNENTTLYDGEKEFLLALKNSNIKCAILTNKPHAATLSVCNKFFKDVNFDIILGQTEKFPAKPAPNSALYIAKTLNVLPQNCMFIGDGETDVLTAKNANMQGVSVLWGYRDKSVLKNAGATLFANDFNELKNLVFHK